MQGKRVDRLDDSLFQSGEYGKISDGNWYCCPPDSDLVGNLSGHEVVEHEDGTISVTPSILISSHKGESWHGWLTYGKWQQA